jgi:trimeric autotransporter adhesin
MRFVRALPIAFASLLGCSQVLDAANATYSSPAGSIDRSMLREGDHFGGALALWEDELIVGAPSAILRQVSSNSDAACGARIDADQAGRVFAIDLSAQDSSSAMREVEREHADNDDGIATHLGIADQPFIALALSSDLLAVGVPGMEHTACAAGHDVDQQVTNAGGVYLFERSDDGSFEQIAFLTTPHPITDGLFGGTLALTGDHLFVGAPGEDSLSEDGEVLAAKGGAVYLFERDGSDWSELARLVPENPTTNASFGSALAISGDAVAIGAFLDSHSERGVNPTPIAGITALLSGAAYVFREQDGHYQQEAYIKAENADANDIFGTSLALEGDTLVVGAMLEAAAHPLPHADAATLGATVDNKMFGAGAVYVYRRNDDGWRFDGYIKAPEPQYGSGFGNALAMHDGRLLIGAVNEGIEGSATDPDQDDSGAAYLFDSIDPDVTPRIFRPDVSDKQGLYGYSVALGPRWLVIGGSNADGQRGDVRVFEVER